MENILNVKRYALNILLLSISFILVACGGETDGDDKTVESLDSSNDPVVLRLGHHHAVDGAVDQLAVKFAEIVEDKSGGSIDVQVYPGAQLGQELELVEGINLGTLEMSIVSPALLEDYSSIFGRSEERRV